MLIPVGSDAPLYHRPVSTIGLILANVALFIGIRGLNPSNHVWRSWILEYGTGYHPAEWLTVHFVHFGFFHLLGNMIFLLLFGIIIEGKIGWWRFLLLYFAIGFGGAVTIQTAMLGYSGPIGGAGGSSLIVFGLVGVAVIWAPENEIDFLFIFYFRLGLIVKSFFVRIWVLGIFYFAEQILWLSVKDFEMGSEAAHLIGVVFGVAIAVVFLRLRWVDCENWDLFSLWKGKHREGTSSWIKSRKEKPNEELPVVETVKPPVEFQLQALNLAISERRFEDAQKIYDGIHAEYDCVPLGGDPLQALARHLYQKKQWEDVAPILEECVWRYPASSALQAIQLAAIAIEILNRPKFALRVLDAVVIPEVGPLKKNAAKIRRIAQKRITEGVMEIL
jgi:membrane associated rhomboid family serine protease